MVFTNAPFIFMLIVLYQYFPFAHLLEQQKGYFVVIQFESSPLKAIFMGHWGKGEKTKFWTKLNLIRIAFAPKDETRKPFR